MQPFTPPKLAEEPDDRVELDPADVLAADSMFGLLPTQSADLGPR